jgi:hypothetical protein
LGTHHDQACALVLGQLPLWASLFDNDWSLPHRPREGAVRNHTRALLLAMSAEQLQRRQQEGEEAGAGQQAERGIAQRCKPSRCNTDSRGDGSDDVAGGRAAR